MKKTLILTKRQENQLEQILNELIFSLKKTFSEEDLLSLSSILKESGKQTYHTKKDTTIKLFKSVREFSDKAYLFTKNKVSNYKKYGIQNEITNDIIYTSYFLKKTPENIKKFGSNLNAKAISFNEDFIKKTKDEKIELISVSLMGVFIFFASGGGEDLEGGIPDLDLNLGIGYHRHFISHSIIMGFISELIMRFGIELINKSYKNLPQEHHSFWDKSNDFVNKNKGIAIGAMWAGIGAHLIKDSGVLGHGVKAYTGLPLEMSMNTHQALFAANGTASAIFAYNDAKNNSQNLK